MSEVYIFRYNSSGANFDGNSSNVEHISSDAGVSTYRWTIPSDWNDVEQLEVLVVGGGGGGGRASAAAQAGAGGGGGGVIYSRSIFLENVVDEDGKVDIEVGNGGNSSESRDSPRADPGFDGHNSSFAHLVALGGGGGASTDSGPSDKGGSGGGGNVEGTSGTPFGGKSLQVNTHPDDIVHMGFPGGFNNHGNTSSSRGAGGGGAMGPGGGVDSDGSGNGMDGGPGFETNIESATDTRQTKIYGAGGGGGRRGSGNSGGLGGGVVDSGAGNGGSPNASNGTDHRGGGGGGGGTDSGGAGGNGGSGIVVLRKGRIASNDLIKQQRQQFLSLYLSGRAAQATPDLEEETLDLGDENDVLGDGKGANAIAVSALGTVITAQEKGFIYRSTDKGVSWSNVYDANDAELSLNDVHYFPEIHAFFVVGTQRTLLRSLDDGHSWEDLSSSLENNTDLSSDANCRFVQSANFTKEDDQVIRMTIKGKDIEDYFAIGSDDYGLSWTMLDAPSSLDDILTRRSSSIDDDSNVVYYYLSDDPFVLRIRSSTSLIRLNGRINKENNKLFKATEYLTETLDLEKGLDDVVRLIGYVGIDDGEGTVQVFDASDMELLDTFSKESTGRVKGIVVANNGNNIVVAYESGNVYRIERNSFTSEGSVDLGNSINQNCIVYDTGKDVVVVGDSSGTVRQIEITGDMEIKSDKYDARTNSVTAMTHTTGFIFVGYDDGIVVKLNVNGENMEEQGQADVEGSVTAMAFLMGHVFVGKSDGSVVKLKMNDMSEEGSITLSSGDSIRSMDTIISLSRRIGMIGKPMLYVASDNGNVYQVDPNQLNVEQSAGHHAGAVTALAIGPRRRNNPPFVVTADDQKLKKVNARDVSEILEGEAELSGAPDGDDGV